MVTSTTFFVGCVLYVKSPNIWMYRTFVYGGFTITGFLTLPYSSFYELKALILSYM